MATEAIHEGVVRFESAGTLVFSDGTDILTVNNIVPGSLSFEPPARGPLGYTDRAVQQAPLEGDDTLGTLSFRTRGTKFETNNLFNRLNTANATANTMKEWVVTIKVPNYRDAAAGTVTVLSGASRTKTDFKAGTDFDEIGVEMSFRSWTPPTTY